MKIAAIFCCTVLCIILMSSQLYAEQPAVKLKVGVYESAPFAYRDELGKWTGVTVDLWEAIAKDKRYDFEFVEVSRKEAVSRLASGDIDIIAAALPVTLENEILIDFSVPYYAANMAIAIIKKPIVTIEGAVARVLFSWQFWAFVVCLVLAFTLIAFLMWYFESRENPEYHGPTKVHGIAYSIYWAVAMMTGAGEKAPKTLQGRIIAITWLIGAFLIAGVFTACITTVLNVESLGHKISSERDLPNVYVAITHGPCEKLLNEMNVRYMVCADKKECFSMLEKGRVDAVVGGEPYIKHYAATEFKGRLDIIPMDYDELLYSIGLRSKSELTEDVNRAILKITSTYAWAEILERYLKH